MIDLRTERTWPPLTVQIVGVWLAALVGFIGTGWLALLGFFLKSPGLVGVSLVGPLLMFFLVGSLSQPAGLLTGRLLPRVGWAVLVTLFGTLGAVFYMSVLEASEPADPGPWPAALGVGVPFALVTAMLVRPLVIRLVAMGLTAALVALGIWLPTTLPHDDAPSRLAHANLPGDVLLMATPDAYEFPTLSRPDGEVVLEYRPTGKAQPLSYWPKLITRKVSPDQPADVREDGLVYRKWADNHLYLRREHGVEIVAMVPDDIPKDAVRAFVLSARPATDAEIMRLLPQAPDRRNRDVLERFTRTIARLGG
ncbi:hypothetical protein [Saccharothrix sp.]|uniref:hypothetical protein n=1 Tax=Saccharothrix sp. TaxID=1873460 RepID=UPI00281228C5|nr:hypothetical protein [Saccharothrix sp.]